jgi:hypothetical protein
MNLAQQPWQSTYAGPSVQFQANNLNQLTSASRSGTLTVAGNVSQGTAPYTVSVTGPGLSSAAAEVYADSSWACSRGPCINCNCLLTALPGPD